MKNEIKYIDTIVSDGLKNMKISSSVSSSEFMNKFRTENITGSENPGSEHVAFISKGKIITLFVGLLSVLTIVFLFFGNNKKENTEGLKAKKITVHFIESPQKNADFNKLSVDISKKAVITDSKINLNTDKTVKTVYVKKHIVIKDTIYKRDTVYIKKDVKKDSLK